METRNTTVGDVLLGLAIIAIPVIIGIILSRCGAFDHSAFLFAP